MAKLSQKNISAASLKTQNIITQANFVEPNLIKKPQKTLLIFAGPNGAGKTTLRERLGVADLLCICPDIFYANDKVIANIADEGKRNELAAMQAARVYMKSIKAGIPLVAIETALASRGGKVPAFLADAIANGYYTVLHGVATDNAEINKMRVGERVKKGGHNVPHTLIDKRHGQFLSTLPAVWNAVNEGSLYDNTSPDTPFRLFYQKSGNRIIQTGVLPSWAAHLNIQSESAKTPPEQTV